MLNQLFESLQKRLRPEDVAEMILVALKNDLSAPETKLLQKAAAHSLKKQWQQLTSMAQDFYRPVAPVKQARKAVELFETAFVLSEKDCASVEKVSKLVKRISAEIRKNAGGNSFKFDRLNNQQRVESGLDISRRRYNKLFRFLTRFELKIETYKRELRKYRATRIAKSSLATEIEYQDFAASLDAACFIAYFTARANRRSVFTDQSQDRPFDEVAAMLLNRFKRNPNPAGWRAISYVMPDAEIVARLSDEDKVLLSAEWLAVLTDIAELLKETWERSRFDRAKMIVRRGDDSSTWNALAGAWNSARQGWFSTVQALGMTSEIERMCFGKVMRLMAADVAAWHLASGGDVEPDTLVWAELPAPWQVLAGEAECSRELVESVCRKHNIDPLKKGWTQPRGNRAAVEFKPTPELVHGVAVAHPELALVLRKAGWFSGKPKTFKELPENAPDFIVERDATGAATGVTLKSDDANGQTTIEQQNESND